MPFFLLLGNPIHRLDRNLVVVLESAFFAYSVHSQVETRRAQILSVNHVLHLMEIWLRIVACLDRSVHAFQSCRERHRLLKFSQNGWRLPDHWDCGPGGDSLRENRIAFEMVSDIQ